MRKAARIKLSLFLGLAVMIAVWLSPDAHAQPPYETYSLDGYGHIIRTPAAYYPEKVIADDINVIKEEKGIVTRTYSPLRRPQDLFIDKHDQIYIADTDNNRIVHLDAKGAFVRAITVPKSPLNKPQGVFVTAEGTIYIADTGNKRVVKLDEDGRLLQVFGRPKSSYMNDSFLFEPINMVVDKRGFLYIISSGSYQGVVQLDPQGNWFGFYGTNTTEVSLMDIIRRTFYSQEQLSRQVRTLPAAIRNIFIDDEGFIYTVSGTEREQVKKLNIRGENAWKNKNFSNRIGSQTGSADDGTGSAAKSQLTDITVSPDGSVIAIDKTSNTVSQYSADGELQFAWSGRIVAGQPQLGISQSPVSIASNSKKELYVLDDSQNLIHVLKPTEFGAAIGTAASLTREGKYEESEARWKDVLRQNALYSPAYQELAQIAYNKGDYTKAMELYKMAGDAGGYSDSFWQIRLKWFQSNFSFIANSIVGLGLALWLISRLRKKHRGPRPDRPGRWWKRNVLLGQLWHAVYMIKHPIDGFGDLRYKNKGSYVSAFILLTLTAGVLLVKQYGTSFSFLPVPAEWRSSTFVYVFLFTWLSWVVCNYLIGTIKQGEARFKDVFIGNSYCLFPVVLLGLPLALLSNVMTLNELSIYSFFDSSVYIWCALLFFWNIQEVQNYSVGETIVSIVLTAVAMVIMWVLISIVVGLTSELRGFVYSIYQEVSM
ncbi:YIP1 family protein [Paenibacillus durus]|uniref:PknD n=1 Tax=Paenibacillus durus ATCC 35681 TaxID=1333534 RepID=A0A0F7FBW3_PAEDU|nr:YIP1 family protein [Paenibacillus durus]AKG36235.1 PknD [Paenibacillus durus ATCC 35681]